MAEFKEIVRIAGADLLGGKQVMYALRKIQGINFVFSNAVCRISGIDIKKKVGDLEDGEVERLNKAITDVKGSNVLSFLLNRRRDYDTGEDKHLVSSDLKLQKEFDIKKLRKIKSYRGMRHSWGLPMRGQRTKSNFRHGKTVGVRKKGMKK